MKSTPLSPFRYGFSPARVVALAALCFSASLLFAEAARTPVARKSVSPATGWVSLFNGKDLTGWVKVGEEKWEVEEGGVIHGRGISTSYGYLRTEKKYVDFQMSLRFKCEADGNSGVFFRTEFEPGSTKIAHGLQFEIDRVVGRHTGGIFGDGHRGGVVWPAPENELVIRPNDWNDYLLEVRGNRYISRLNGVVMVDFTDPAPISFDGYIALQLHSGGKGDMRFKDLYIRDLTKR
ncbi:MAG: hypothetical protein RIQ93_837 [Verrucomicrobiota bacterium]|jgi:hypothetical protein